MRHGGGIQYAVERVGQIGESLETGCSFEIGCDFMGMMESYENGNQNAAPDVMSFNAVSELKTCTFL